MRAAIVILAEQPRPSWAERLLGGEGGWRVRTGDHGIVYEMQEQILLVLAIAVGHRREIHRRR